MNGLRTGEVAQAAGVNAQTLRYYERRGLLAEPDRTLGGHRVYAPTPDATTSSRAPARRAARSRSPSSPGTDDEEGGRGCGRGGRRLRRVLRRARPARRRPDRDRARRGCRRLAPPTGGTSGAQGSASSASPSSCTRPAPVRSTADAHDVPRHRAGGQSTPADCLCTAESARVTTPATVQSRTRDRATCRRGCSFCPENCNQQRPGPIDGCL